VSAGDILLEEARRDMARSLYASIGALPGLRVTVAEWEREDFVTLVESSPCGDFAVAYETDSITREELRLAEIARYCEERDEASRRRTVAVRSDGGAHLIEPRKLFKPGAP